MKLNQASRKDTDTGEFTVPTSLESSRLAGGSKSFTNRASTKIGRGPLPKRVSAAQAELNKIVGLCKVYKGQSTGEISNAVEGMKLELDIQLLKQRYQQQKSL
jgi:hypothetical protein